MGTLMWIGPTDDVEFRSAFDFCAHHVPQLAMRWSVEEAIDRPATGVRWMIFASPGTVMNHDELLGALSDHYPDAKIANLAGSLYPGSNRPMSASGSSTLIRWHRWHQQLPEWLVGGNQETKTSSRNTSSTTATAKHDTINDSTIHRFESHPMSASGVYVPSVAILADTYANAEALIETASSIGVTAFWCRGHENRRIRNANHVWWDDSAAGPASAVEWTERIAQVAVTNATHTWIVHQPQRDQIEQASQAGINHIVSKPYRLTELTESLQASSKYDDALGIPGDWETETQSATFPSSSTRHDSIRRVA